MRNGTRGKKGEFPNVWCLVAPLFGLWRDAWMEVSIYSLGFRDDSFGIGLWWEERSSFNLLNQAVMNCKL